MGYTIVHHEGRFLEWSSIIDAPICFGMDAVAFRDWCVAKYGTEGAWNLQRRMDDAVTYGSSAKQSLKEIVWHNRAGPGEGQMTVEDVIRFYFVERRRPKYGEVVCVPDEEA